MRAFNTVVTYRVVNNVRTFVGGRLKKQYVCGKNCEKDCFNWYKTNKPDVPHNALQPGSTSKNRITLTDSIGDLEITST